MANGIVFVPDPKGISEVAKSSGVKSELMDRARSMAETVNREAEANAEALGIGTFNVTPYGYDVDELKYTSVGVVYTRHSAAGMNEARFKTLSSQAF